MDLPCDEMFLHKKNYGVKFILIYSWGLEADWKVLFIVFGSPGGRAPNPRVPKSPKMQTYVQQEKIIDNQFFIGCHNVIKKYLFGYYILSM